MKALE
jgi:uncharacterized protein YeeX (DUF496 family)